MSFGPIYAPFRTAVADAASCFTDVAPERAPNAIGAPVRAGQMRLWTRVQYLYLRGGQLVCRHCGQLGTEGLFVESSLRSGALQAALVKNLVGYRLGGAAIFTCRYLSNNISHYGRYPHIRTTSHLPADA
jgi:hypothetical protein